MKKIFLILLTILTVLTACNQRQENESNKLGDSVTMEMKNTQDLIASHINKLDSIPTELGIGVVSINFDDNTTLHFYATPIDKDPLRTIQFFTDPAINSWNIRDLDKHQEWLKPEILWLDYSQFVFRCLTLDGNWLKVMVNNENGETLWIKKNDITTYKNWEIYLTEMFGVARLPNQPQKIRILPSDNSDQVIYKGQDCFKVKSMKGDWIEIFSGDYCDESYTDSQTKIKSGWIKWRNGNKLLIEYFATS